MVALVARFGFVVVVLQRQQQRQIRVAVEGALVGAEIERAEPGDEPVVGDVELLARFDDAFFRAAVDLGAQAIAHGVAHLDQAANPASGSRDGKSFSGRRTFSSRMQTMPS